MQEGALGTIRALIITIIVRAGFFTTEGFGSGFDLNVFFPHYFYVVDELYFTSRAKLDDEVQLVYERILKYPLQNFHQISHMSDPAK